MPFRILNTSPTINSTPNIAAQELIEDEEIKNSDIAFPDFTQYDNLETFHYLGPEGDELYNDLWKEVKSQWYFLNPPDILHGFSARRISGAAFCAI